MRKGCEVLQEWAIKRADIARFKHLLLPYALLFLNRSKVPTDKLERLLLLSSAYSFCLGVWVCRRTLNDDIIRDMEDVVRLVLLPTYLEVFPEKSKDTIGHKFHNLLVPRFSYIFIHDIKHYFRFCSFHLYFW
jgi:hypothetical protein